MALLQSLCRGNFILRKFLVGVLMVGCGAPLILPEVPKRPAECNLKSLSSASQFDTASLSPQVPALGENFGFSLVTSGNTLVVGAQNSTRAGLLYSGAAFVFERVKESVWRQAAVLTAGDAGIGDNFGYSVAMSGESLAVGAPFHETSGVPSGAVYLFNRGLDGGWHEETKLLAPAGEAFDIFGVSLAHDGERIAVGALRAGLQEEGAVFVYVRKDGRWQFEAELLPGDGASYAHFGTAVAMAGDTLLVGAPADRQLATAAGAVYVFERDETGWHKTAKLLAGDGRRGDFFGYAVDLDQGTAVIGTYLKRNVLGSATGAVYVFRKIDNVWLEQERVISADVASGDRFGISVSIFGDVLAVGSSRSDGAGENAGSIYVFRYVDGRWEQLKKLYRVQAMPEDEYGQSVHVAESGFIAGGAWNASSVLGASVGAVDVVSYEPCALPASSIPR
jgi:hypothetical protein